MPDTIQKTAWGVGGGSVRGASHLRTGLPNQDSLGTWSGESGNRAMVVVSDGHGSGRHFRSDTGSRMAVDAATSVLRDVALPIGDAEMRQLGGAIVASWRERVKAHLAEHPFEAAEWQHVPDAEREEAEAAVAANPVVAYGATLLAVLAAGPELLFLQLGDGDILCVPEGGASSRPMHEDSRLIANQTTSLCQNEAPENFRYGQIHGDGGPLPKLILLSSDGYSNSFATDEDFLQVGSDYLNLLLQFGSEKVVAQLEHILSEASRKGSGDDITLGMLERTGGGGAETPAPAPAPEPVVLPPSQPRSEGQTPAPVGETAPRSQHVFHKYKVALAAAILLAAVGIALAWWHPPAVTALFERITGHHGSALRLPGGERVALTAGSVLSAAQLRLNPPFDGPVLEVASSHDGLVLRNRSGKEWKAAGPGGGEPGKIDIGAAVPARNGETVYFGAVELTVVSD